MKKVIVILILIFPLSLTAQTYIEKILPGIFSFKNDELRSLILSKDSMVKMSNKEIDMIINEISERRDNYFETINKIHKSIPRDSNGKIIGKADIELRNELSEQNAEIYDSVSKIIGQKRCRQFVRTLIYEEERKSSERRKNYLQTKK